MTLVSALRPRVRERSSEEIRYVPSLRRVARRAGLTIAVVAVASAATAAAQYTVWTNAASGRIQEGAEGVVTRGIR